MVDKTQAKALQDFAQEAEEILEGLAEDLEQVQEQFESDGKVKPDRLNKIFREMHSLKGLASMFNLERITKLSHDLESLLDKIRLGKVKVNRSLFALLNDSRVALRNLVSEARQGEETTGIEDLLHRITAEEAGPTIPTADSLGGLQLDEATLKSLTEYEEHRLRENIEEENHIFAVKVSFDFADFDTRLRALSERLSESGEVISTLPVMDPNAAAGIHFRLVYGTRSTLEDVKTLVTDWRGEVSDLLPGKGPAPPAPAPAEPGP
ncbi:MAG TPA: Hpt domain-containing protein, partial [Myxococcota bacterium]|nr:Hpt domain-containing protein [Myxococcota bacterium]